MVHRPNRLRNEKIPKKLLNVRPSVLQFRARLFQRREETATINNVPRKRTRYFQVPHLSKASGASFLLTCLAGMTQSVAKIVILLN